jgi:hypothetical protein
MSYTPMTTNYEPTVYDVKRLLEILDNPLVEANLKAQGLAVDWKAVALATKCFLKDDEKPAPSSTPSITPATITPGKFDRRLIDILERLVREKQDVTTRVINPNLTPGWQPQQPLSPNPWPYLGDPIQPPSYQVTCGPTTGPFAGGNVQTQNQNQSAISQADGDGLSHTD